MTRAALPRWLVIGLAAFTVGAATVALTGSPGAPAGVSGGSPTLNGYWNGIAAAPSEPGLWRCATAQTSSKQGAGALISVHFNHWELTLAYVANFPEYVVLPNGHPAAQSVELTHRGQPFSANVNPGPYAGDNLVLQGACLVRFTESAPPVGLLAYSIYGAAGCCSIDRAVVPGPPGLARIIDINQPLPTVTLLRDEDGHSVIVTGDFFQGEFTDDADSWWSMMVLTLTNHQFVDVTGQYPALVRDDARGQWGAYKRAVLDRRPVEGALAQWMADECVLNQGPAAWVTLTGIVEKGIPPTIGQGPGGGAYLSQLAALLHSRGYCEGVSLPD